MRTRTYTRDDLAKDLADTHGLTLRYAKELIETILVRLGAELSSGNRVEFRGFGIFSSYVRKPKVGRNPGKPGPDYVIPARRVVKFRPGRYVDEMLNESKPKPSCEAPSPS